MQGNGEIGECFQKAFHVIGKVRKFEKQCMNELTVYFEFSSTERKNINLQKQHPA